MSQAQYPSEVSTRIHAILDFPAKKEVLIGPLGSLFYGDQDKLPTTPAVCVEAGTTSRTSVGAQRLTTHNHECFILVYHSKVQDVETNKLESEQIAEGIAKELDRNPFLVGPNGEEGVVIDGYCSRIDPGYAVKEGTLYKAVRIQWNGISRTILGA